MSGASLPLHLAARREVPADHPAFAGHFPGHPLLPGVALVSEALELARTDAGLAARLDAGFTVQQAKFLAPVGPGASLDVTVDADDAGLRFEIVRAGVTAARGAIAWEPAR